ncbi:MAG: EAL domain-containing protein [Chromatiaceae bacterium]
MQVKYVMLLVAGEQMQQTVQQFLPESDALQLIVVNNSADAIAILKQKYVNLILTEIEIGGIDGWRLARLVRANVLKCEEKTPIILLSATYCERITETTARAYGIDLVLPKEQVAQIPQIVARFQQTEQRLQQRQTILIVEDDADIAELAKRIVLPNYDVEIAVTGPQAVDMYRCSSSYALVLLDVMLPELNGQEVLAEIMRLNPKQSVVVMTAHGGIELAEQMMLQGAADFVNKPFRAEQLRRVIDVAAMREDFLISNEQFKQKVQQLAGSEERYRDLSEVHQRVLDHVSTVLMELTSAGTIKFANRAWYDLTAHSAVADPDSFLHFLRPADQALVRTQLAAICAGDLDQWRTELQLAQPNFWMSLNMAALPDKISGVTVTLENIDERKKAEQELQHLAMHDPLTGLYNRHFSDRELMRIAALASDKQSHALMYIDLDHFKVVNDSHGHSQGDAILREVANRLAMGLSADDLLCRVGGDEFVVISPAKTLEQANELATRLCVALDAQPYRLMDKVYTLSCSIGVTIVDGSQPDAQVYLQQADIALYVAKAKGRNRAHCYSVSDAASDKLRNSLQWAQQLREAIVNDQIVMHFQPIMCVRTGAIAYYEALVRLNLNGNIVYPGEFIQALEQVEDINLLDHQVIGKTIEMMSRHAVLKKVAINLSAQAFRDERLVPWIEQTLLKYQVEPSRVVFELTETASLNNIAGTCAMFNQLNRLGCEFSIDDFGTGFSTFSYIKQLPASSIKIDGSFVKNMHQDTMDFVLVKAMAEIAHALGRKSVAEFVENEQILTLLQQLGVDYAQGYHISKPMPIEILEKTF